MMLVSIVGFYAKIGESLCSDRSQSAHKAVFLLKRLTVTFQGDDLFALLCLDFDSEKVSNKGISPWHRYGRELLLSMAGMEKQNGRSCH